MDFLKKMANEVVSESVNGSNKHSNNNQNSNNENNNNDENKNSNNSNSNDNNNSSSGTNSNSNSSFDNKVGEAVLGKLNNVLGGGEKGEQKEDVLDKAIDLFQEHVLKSGSQSNESAIEQAKDAQIASVIRSGYKTVTGNDFPISKSS